MRLLKNLRILSNSSNREVKYPDYIKTAVFVKIQKDQVGEKKFLCQVRLDQII